MRSATMPVQPGLVRGAEPGAVVAVEVLVEHEVVLPRRVRLQPFDLPEARSAAVRPDDEQGDQALAQVVGDLAERERVPAAGRVLDLEVVAEEPVVALEGADHEVVEREPDRPAPVGVAAEHRRRRLGRLVVDRRPDPLDVELVGVLAVVRRHRAQAVRRQELVARRTAWRTPSAGGRRRRRRAAGAACPGSPRTSPCSVRPVPATELARADGRTPCRASRRDRGLARRARPRPAAG